MRLSSESALLSLAVTDMLDFAIRRPVSRVRPLKLSIDDANRPAIPLNNQADRHCDRHCRGVFIGINGGDLSFATQLANAGSRRGGKGPRFGRDYDRGCWLKLSRKGYAGDRGGKA